MLPIARNNAFRVPHSLAALAAGICLVLAFSSDFRQRQEPLVNAPADPETHRITVVDESLPAGTPKGDGRAREALSSRSNTRWIPWFPGLRPGGG